VYVQAGLRALAKSDTVFAVDVARGYLKRLISTIAEEKGRMHWQLLPGSGSTCGSAGATAARRQAKPRCAESGVTSRRQRGVCVLKGAEEPEQRLLGNRGWVIIRLAEAQKFDDAYQLGLVHFDFREPEVEDFHLAHRQHQVPNGDFGLPTDNKSGRRIVQLGVRFLF
jgi:hypothetical protein